jgi:hypothetical protein
MTEATPAQGGFATDLAAALAVGSASGCCGSGAVVTETSPCCGSGAEAAAEGSCCGSGAKTEAVAAGQGCCG